MKTGIKLVGCVETQAFLD